MLDCRDLSHLNSIIGFFTFIHLLIVIVDGKGAILRQHDEPLTPLLENFFLLVKSATQVPLFDHLLTQGERANQLATKLSHVFLPHHLKLGVPARPQIYKVLGGRRRTLLRHVDHLKVVVLLDANVS